MDKLLPWIAVLVMAMTVFGLRYAGFAIMSFIKITPRIELFLEKMSISVLVAIVASSILSGGVRTGTAVVVGVAAMLVGRSPIVAMLAGMASGAVWSFVVL
ncbi:MAG: AzlD family protein [Paracoccaceae bacterium]